MLEHCKIDVRTIFEHRKVSEQGPLETCGSSQDHVDMLSVLILGEIIRFTEVNGVTHISHCLPLLIVVGPSHPWSQRILNAGHIQILLGERFFQGEVMHPSSLAQLCKSADCFVSELVMAQMDLLSKKKETYC